MSMGWKTSNLKNYLVCRILHWPNIEFSTFLTGYGKRQLMSNNENLVSASIKKLQNMYFFSQCDFQENEH